MLLLVASMMALVVGASGVAWAGKVRHKPKPPKVIQVVPVEETLHRQDPDSTG